MQYMEVGAYNKSQLLTYDRAKMDVMTAVSALSDSKDEGIEIGLAKGRAEATAKIAVNALKNGILPEDVSKLTGLSPDEIRKLRNEIALFSESEPDGASLAAVKE
jgi:hypothetical protein